MKNALAISIALLVLFMTGDILAKSKKITQPGQPLYGYGSSENYICNKLKGGKAINHHNCIDFGDTNEGTRCWVYIPQRLKNGISARVLVFLHGFMALVPPIYDGLIVHFVRQGYIVIFPEYNKGGFLGMFKDMDQYEMLRKAIDATDQALALKDVAPIAELENITLASHSNGGMMSLGWSAYGGVPLKNIVMLHPNISLDAQPKIFRDLFMKDFKFLDFHKMGGSITCPVIMVGGEKDTMAMQKHCHEVYDVLENSPSSVYYEFYDDSHGKPAISSDHLAPCQNSGIIPKWVMDLIGKLMGITAMEEDAVDFRICYAAIDAALDGQTRIDFDLGEWSDGVPVKPVKLIHQFGE